MSKTQTLLWIALPGGIRTDGNENRLRLSVFVTPRLRTDEDMTLATFPDFLQWAALMQPGAASFTVEINDGSRIEATRVGDSPDTNLWQTLFPSDVPVRPYEFDDHANRPIISYPVSAVLGYVKQAYQTIAASQPFDLPPISRREGEQDRTVTLDRTFRDLVEMHRESLRVSDEAQLMEKLNASLEHARAEARRRYSVGAPGGSLIEPAGLAAAGEPRDAFYRSMLFHYRPAKAEPLQLPEKETARARFEEEFDFHQMLSALNDYPKLLRLLGLIFDIEVPAILMSRGSDVLPPLKLRVVPTWASAFPRRQPGAVPPWTDDLSPWTAYRFTQKNGVDLFMSARRQGEVASGLWVPEGEVDVMQVDVDGAALKTLNLTASLARTTLGEAPRAIDSPDEAGVPTLRTGGISIVRGSNAQRINDSFNRSQELNAILESDPPQLADLYAEDLVQGYRVDVFGGRPGQWRSLHRRVGTYTVLSAAGAIPDIIDEGFTQMSVTGPPRDPAAQSDPGRELYVHEALFTWDGWSLSAPRPGKSISRSARAPSLDDPDSQPQRIKNTAMTRLGLETSFRVEDTTLPRLRFGNVYRLRVRTVDLAGAGLSLDEATALKAIWPDLNGHLPRDSQLRYCRFEPINPPELVPRQLYSPDGDLNSPSVTGYAEGESLERLVIRSNFDQSAEEYAATHTAYSAVNERHVVAPKASLQLIEMHGLLDEALDAKSSGLSGDEIRARVRTIYDLAKRESGSLSDATLPTVRFIRTSADPASQDGYAVHTEEQLILPYLPDPWARAVVFQGLPRLDPGKLMSVEFGGETWHEPTPFRLRLVEGSDAPAWDAVARVLTVSIPKSGIARIRVSSQFGGDLEVMGLWQWLLEAAGRGDISDNRLAELKQGIHEGRHWMFTPFRVLTLVHAVEQPLEEPRPHIEAIPRATNSTAAHLRGVVELHAPSTSKIDLVAQWTANRDDPSRRTANRNDPPRPEEPDTDFDTREHACEHVAELPTAFDGKPVRIELAREAADALHVDDDKVLVFNTKQALSARNDFQKMLGNPALSASERRRVQDEMNLAAKVTAHEFGDTKYRRVTYSVRATSRFREYFASTLPTDSLVRTSPEFTLDILSSARPAAPRVLYALPTFGWKLSGGPSGTVTSKREGGGVRIYLDRPWWSSGDGELLAVVLHLGPADPRDPVYPYSTYWGQDPTWLAPALPLPRPESFRNRKAVFTGVKLAELNDHATVVAFDVAPDKARKLWFCDLELDTAEAYYPFIRLALARIQPNSVTDETDERLSSVVLADFVQTAPDRTTTIVRDPNAAGTYAVAVSGVTYSAQRTREGAVAASVSQVEIVIQRRDETIKDETLGWRDLTTGIVLTPGAPDEHGIVTWRGTVTAPTGSAGAPMRILVQEFEAIPLASLPDPAHSTGRRLVHADMISL